MEKVDLFRLHKVEYAAKEAPAILEIPTARFLTIEGKGDPSGAEFADRLGALYNAAYSVKFLKKQAGQDYAVCKLEGLWWGSQGPGDFSSEPRSEWNWKLIIRVPSFVQEEDLSEAVAALKKKGKGPLVGEARLIDFEEGLCVQALHIGPYSEERASIEKMLQFAEKQSLTFHGLHHEIYLSDPRKVAPEALKTILRMPVKRR